MSIKTLSLYTLLPNSKPYRCRMNSAHVRNTRPDSGLGLSHFAGEQRTLSVALKKSLCVACWQVLGEFIGHLSSKSCDSLVQLNGLKVTLTHSLALCHAHTRTHTHTQTHTHAHTLTHTHTHTHTHTRCVGPVEWPQGRPMPFAPCFFFFVITLGPTFD